MKLQLCTTACALALLGASTAMAAPTDTAAPALKPVNITFTAPDRYTDAGNRKFDEADNLKTLDTWMQALGKKYLPSGQTLSIDVLDVDLAGVVRPRAGATELRVLRGAADWPRIQLRYTLQSDGQVLRSGEETVQDLDYLGHTIMLSPSDPLRHEKQMLEDWFKAQFAADRTASR